jgi:hypothetical protein
MFELIQISQGIKTPILKDLLGKPFQTFYYYSLKNLFEKIRIQNTILYLIKPMQANCKGIFFQNSLLSKRFAFSNLSLKMNFKCYFIKYFI